uniref:Ig-like domain-containing protein n=1 Tax=Oreochromis niloticus TaxID=8128 RepID=A0A669BVV8_ORENI
MERSSESSFDFKLSASPKLLMEMSDVRVKSGEMAEFSCSFDGQPFSGVVWEHNGESLVDTERVRSSQSGGFLSLVIQAVGVADQGMYRCTATNEHGQNSSSAQLTVEEFTKTIESLQLQEGAQGFFRYTVTGDPLPEVQWLKGTSHIQPSGFCIIHTLEITGVKAADSGLYVCKVSNNVGTAECHTELCVIDKPNFVRPLGSVAAVVGAPLHLECQVDEDTGVTVTWTRDGRKFQGKYSICNFCKSAVLEINTVQFSATTIWKQGSTARLQCTVKGSPELHTTWFLNNSELSTSGRHAVGLKDGVATLEIHNVMLTDSGNYTCEVLNECGCESCSIKVTVKGV